MGERLTEEGRRELKKDREMLERIVAVGDSAYKPETLAVSWIKLKVIRELLDGEG